MIGRNVKWANGFSMSRSAVEARAFTEYQSVYKSDLDVTNRRLELTKDFGNGWFGYIVRHQYFGSPIGRGCIKLY